MTETERLREVIKLLAPRCNECGRIATKVKVDVFNPSGTTFDYYCEKHARDGWLSCQPFAPGIAASQLIYHRKRKKRTLTYDR